MEKVFKYLLLSVMILIAIGCNLNLLDSFIFIGSFNATSYLFEPNKIIITGLTILFIILVFVKIKARIKTPALFLVFIFWILSGRTISITPYPNGKVTTGWFYVKTDSFQLCEEGVDCETELVQNTSINKLSLWRISFDNDNLSKKIFISPFLWSSFNEKIQGILGNQAN